MPKDKPKASNQSNMLVDDLNQVIGVDIYLCYTMYYVVVRRGIKTFNKWLDSAEKGSSHTTEVFYRAKRDYQKGMQTGICRINSRKAAMSYIKLSAGVTEFTKNGITRVIGITQEGEGLMPILMRLDEYSDAFLLNKIGRVTGFFKELEFIPDQPYFKLPPVNNDVTVYPYSPHWKPVNNLTQLVHDKEALDKFERLRLKNKKFSRVQATRKRVKFLAK